MDTFLITLFCIILTLATSNSDVSIRVKILDPSGGDLSLLYEGGTLAITCAAKKECKLYHEVAKSKRATYRKRASGNQKESTSNIKISSSILEQKYKCDCDSESSSGLAFNYALCDPRLLKPRKVCSKADEFCQITKKGSAVCQGLTQASCNYSSPTFNVVCPGGKGRPKNQTGSALCYSLADPSNSPPEFLATDSDECDQEFKAYVCDSDCRVKRQLAMGGWQFVDLAHPFSIVTQVSKSNDYDVACNASTGAGDTIRANRVKLAKDDLTNMTELGEQLRRLSTPTIADIVCIGSSGGAGRFQLRTNLLLFTSDKDLKLDTAKQDLGNGSVRATINVTATDGLYVCVKEGTGNCAPTNDSNAERLAITTSGMATFYIGLFTSAPKAKYVPIYNKTVNVSVQPLSMSPTTATTAKSDTRETTHWSSSHEMSTKQQVSMSSHEVSTRQQASSHGMSTKQQGRMSSHGTNPKQQVWMHSTTPMTKGHSWKVKWMIGFIVGGILLAAALAAGIVIVVSCVKRKKAKTHPGDKTKHAILARKLKKKSPPRKHKAALGPERKTKFDPRRKTAVDPRRKTTVDPRRKTTFDPRGKATLGPTKKTTLGPCPKTILDPRRKTTLGPVPPKFHPPKRPPVHHL